MRCLILALVMMLMTTSCRSREELVPPPIVHTPLSLDPTEQIELAGWWSNDEQMVYLDHSAAYRIYGDMNRYHRPIERGRWSKMSYAYMHLEPYGVPNVALRRVEISRIGDDVALTIPHHEPMYSIDHPPLVEEDRLLGEWISLRGTIVITSNSRYRFAPRPQSMETPMRLAGHDGRWELTDRRVTLTPDAPSMKPFVLLLDESEPEPRLIDSHIEYTRVSPNQRDGKAL